MRKLNELHIKLIIGTRKDKSPPVLSSWERSESLNTLGSACVFFLLSVNISVYLYVYGPIIDLVTQSTSTKKILHLHKYTDFSHVRHIIAFVT